VSPSACSRMAKARWGTTIRKRTTTCSCISSLFGAEEKRASSHPEQMEFESKTGGEGIWRCQLHTPCSHTKIDPLSRRALAETPWHKKERILWRLDI
jgi:hypothetical protein